MRRARPRHTAVIPARLGARTQRTRVDDEASYVSALTSVGGGVVTADADGRVDLMNPVAEALTGWRASEAIGRRVEDVLHLESEDTRLPIANFTELLISRYVSGLP